MTPKRTLGRIVDKIQRKHANHVERNTPTGHSFAISDRIDGLDPKAWDELTRSHSIFMSREFIRTLERAGPDNVSPRSALVFQGDRAVAAIAAQRVTLSIDRLPAPDTKRAKAVKLAKMAKLVNSAESILVCGNVLSWGPHGVAFAPDVDAGEVWPAITEALYRMRRMDGLLGDASLLLVKDLTERLAGSTASLERFSYRALETEPNMVLALSPKWRNYEDYLASLKADYRKGARKIAKEIDGAGYELVRLTDIGAHAERLHALYMQVHAAQKMRLFTLSPRFFPEISRAFGERFRISALRRAGEIVGFVSCVRDGETAYGWFLGYDRAANDAPIYLRLMHAVVGDAIEMGCTRLSLGRTALEPKSRLGAKPEVMRTWMRHRIPAMNLVVRRVIASVPHDEAPDRNPFKDEAPTSAD